MPRGVPTDLERRREIHARRAGAMGERIRFYRLLRRKTMQELADDSGCSLHTIWRAETGRTMPRFKTRQRVADALGVSWWAIEAEDLPQTPAELRQRERKREQSSFIKEVSEEAMKEARGSSSNSSAESAGGVMSPRRWVESPSPSRKDRRKKQRTSNGEASGPKKKNRKKKRR